MASRRIRLARVFSSIALGLGLALGLLWAMMPRTAVGAQGVTPGVTRHRTTPEVDESDEVVNRGVDITAAPQSPRVSADRYIRLEKNDDYYDAANVVITEVASLFISEDEAWTRYQSGELDTIVPPDSALAAIKASPVHSPQLHAYASGYIYYYGFSTDVAPFDDPLVRGAFASAIDRPRLISDTLNGDELPALTFTPPGQFGHVDGYTAGVGRPYSPTLAQSQLTSSGYAGTPTITLMYNASSQHQAIAEAVREMWFDTLGISVTLEGIASFGDYLDLLQNGTAQERPGIFRMGWGSDYPDAHNHLVDGFGWGGRLTRYQSAAFDALVQAAAANADPTTRRSLYEEAESLIVMTDTALSPLYYYIARNLVRPDLTRTHRSFGGQRVDEWTFTGDTRSLSLVWGEPSSVDPALAYGFADFDHVGQLFLGLTRYDSVTGEVLPQLATGWEASTDSTVFTFTMRTDASWTDGSPVTAQDVEHGILRSLDPDTLAGYVDPLYIIENAQEFNDGSITDPGLVGVEALDAIHVRFTLHSSAAYFPVIAGLPPARPQPQTTIETHGLAWTDPAHIVSNGPYKLTHWDRSCYLRIGKEGDGDPLSGAAYTFTISYRNDGGAAADSCAITDTMSGGMSYVSDTSGFSHAGSGSGPIIWDLGTVAAYSSSEFEVVVQVSAAPGDEIENRVQIASSGSADLGESWEKEAEWSDEVEGSRMRVDYSRDFVGGIYPAGHTFWLTVTDSISATKATATVSTTAEGAGHGYWDYDGFVTEGNEWSPQRPDIQPGDLVHFQSCDGYSNTMRIGDIIGVLDAGANTVSGTVCAPWFTETLKGNAGAWGFTWESFTVDPDCGSYLVDFAPEDLRPGDGVSVEYAEPDGDRVINDIQPLDLVMNVNYGHHWVQGRYEAGHTVWITATESDGFTIKATAQLTTGLVPGWGGDTGFSTGHSHPWVPTRPDIAPGDWIHGVIDNGYTGTVHIGTITGDAHAASDSIEGTIEATWIDQEVDVECHTWGAPSWAPHKQDTVLPDGVDIYSCSWDPLTEWDVQRQQDIGVDYRDPDGHRVYNVFTAPWRLYLPLALRQS